MPSDGPALPQRFPCLVRAIYSWGGETKRDLGFVEGDLIECLNAGDGSWWMGRLRRNKTVGLFPSNFVEVLPDVLPASRATSPMPARSRNASPSPSGYGGSSRSRHGGKSTSPAGYEQRGRSPNPYEQRGRSPGPYQQHPQERGRSPNPYQRNMSPQPQMQQYRAMSPNPYQRAASPNPYQRAASPNPYQRSASPNPYMRAASPAPPVHRAISPAPSHYRAYSPVPPQHHDAYQAPPSPNPYQPAVSPNSYQRAASPNPYQRAVSPNPYQRAASPNPYQRAASPNPYQRAASPNPYAGGQHDDDDAPPPPPPTHRYAGRPASPMPPPHGNDGRLTPTPSRPPSRQGLTPSPLRMAMHDVMESLEQMTGSESERPKTTEPVDPWSPQAFGAELYNPTPRPGRLQRPETTLGFRRGNDYDDPQFQQRDRMQSIDQGGSYAEQLEDRLSRLELTKQPSVRRTSDDRGRPRGNNVNPDYRKSCYADMEHFDHTRPPPVSGVSAPQLRTRKSAYDLRAHTASPSKMTRPRPLSRMETITTNASSNNSAATNHSASTAATSASIMSGGGASAFSATSAGSYTRHKKALSLANITNTLTGRQSPNPLRPLSRADTPSGYMGSVSGSEGGTYRGRPRGKTWGASESAPPDLLGGLSTPAPKQKKSGFFKKIIASAKTSAASARSVAAAPSPSPLSMAPKTIPDGVYAIEGGSRRSLHGSQQPQDWVQVRRDVNRANTLSRNERIERHERQQMLDQLIIRPVDALDEDVEGDEAADGGIVRDPQDFSSAANLALVDKSARFISSLPPLTTPESLAVHHICRPYRTDVQKLRAIFTWVSEKISWEHEAGPILDDFVEPELDLQRVLSTRRGTPFEVANLVQSMCEALQIPCTVVRGHLKTPLTALSSPPLTPTSPPPQNHVWNAVLCAEEWRFLDCSLASQTHPSRSLLSSAPSTSSDPFYFLTRPSHLCWTHIPLHHQDQHLIPPLPPHLLLALPIACPPFFSSSLQMLDFDTSLTRLSDLEVAQIELCTPADIEITAEVEVQAYGLDPEGTAWIETGDTIRKRALAQACWENGLKVFRIKAVLPSDEGAGILKIYAGKRGLMQSVRQNPHPLALCLPLTHTGENPPYSFVLRHPTPHAQRQDLYVLQPQCSRLAVGNTFVFSVRQGTVEVGAKPAKLGIQTPGGKILRLVRKGGEGEEMGAGVKGEGGVWETVIKCGEKGPWRGLVLADRSARWCVYAEWVVV